MGTPVTEQKFWGLTLMSELRPGLSARWDDAPRAPGIYRLSAGLDSSVAVPNGLFLAFCRHSSLSDRYSRVLGCSLQGADGLLRLIARLAPVQLQKKSGSSAGGIQKLTTATQPPPPQTSTLETTLMLNHPGPDSLCPVKGSQKYLELKPSRLCFHSS